MQNAPAPIDAWAPYTLSTAGLNFLKEVEGNIPYIYDDKTKRRVYRWSDVQGFPTVGLGVKIEQPDRPKFERWLGKTIPKEALDRINEEKIELYTDVLNKKIREYGIPDAEAYVHLSQPAVDVLFSYAWNTGLFSQWLNTLLELYAAKDRDGAIAHIQRGPKTSKGKVLEGLVNRRNREANILSIEPMWLDSTPSTDFGSAAAVLWVLVPSVAAFAAGIYAYKRWKRSRGGRGVTNEQ
jgi:GH24 family phage-related lysozyme (muramidase)